MIAALSDLHMGPGGSLDRFGHEESRFLDFLARLEARYDPIVLLGDLYETHLGRRFGDFAGELGRCRRLRPRIAERFEGPQYLRIFGNHDHVLGRREHVSDRIRMEAGGVRLLFCHGHQFDALIDRVPLVGQLSSWAAARLERRGVRGALAFLDRIDDRLSGLSPDPDTCRYQRRAFEFLAREGADVLVMGHTHLPAVTRRDGKVYVNTGACFDGRLEYAHLDPERGDYEIRRG
ncbi:MAG: metallophosphoesterase family protein [Planctomycetes bacterium]|nr:metallophosphoesterase family protein [Planctomycetota bacterium]